MICEHGVELQVLGLFASPQLPEHWVVEDSAGKYWLVPAAHRGWESRSEYVGDVRWLCRVANWYATGLGLPWNLVELEGGRP